jgi:hypothetical protein
MNDDLRDRARDTANRAMQSPQYPSVYVNEVRDAAARLAAPEDQADDIRAAVAMLEEHAHISDVAPVDSTNRGTRAAKTVVRKAVFFTTNHLATQVSALGWAMTQLGNATADRIEQLERELREVKEHLARIENGDDA